MNPVKIENKRFMNLIKSHILKKIYLIVILLIPFNGYGDVNFDRLHGSDLGMGIGARAIAMGGAFVALADDPSALFWNPAGLSQLVQNQLYFSIDLPTDFSAAAFIYKPTSEMFKTRNLTLGIGWVNRLSFKGDSGADNWEGYPANLLDMAMIDINDDFSGKIDSKTYDLRFSAALTPKDFDRFSLGINLTHIS